MESWKKKEQRVAAIYKGFSHDTVPHHTQQLIPTTRVEPWTKRDSRLD